MFRPDRPWDLRRRWWWRRSRWMSRRRRIIVVILTFSLPLPFLRACCVMRQNLKVMRPTVQPQPTCIDCIVCRNEGTMIKSPYFSLHRSCNWFSAHSEDELVRLIYVAMFGSEGRDPCCKTKANFSQPCGCCGGGGRGRKRNAGGNPVVVEACPSS